jgi:hypothetical protein
MNKAIAYYRPLEASAGIDLDLPVQRAIVQGFVESARLVLAGEWVESVSGPFEVRRDGPILRRALVSARKNRYPIVVAQLAVLASGMGELSAVIATKVRFVVASADAPLVLHAFGLPPIRRSTGTADKGAARLAIDRARAAQSVDAERHASEVSDTIMELRARGFTTLTAMAGELNRRGLATARGARWHASTVRNVILRLEARHGGPA